MSIVKIERMVVTPAMASEWLRRSEEWSRMHPDDKNRPLNEVNISHLVAELLADGFKLTGKAVHIGAPWAWNVLDGQNRLTAGVRTGISFESFVAFDDSETCPRNIPVDTNTTPRSPSWSASVDSSAWCVAQLITKMCGHKSGASVAHYPCADKKTMISVSGLLASYGLTSTARKGLSAAPVRAGVVLAAYLSLETTLVEDKEIRSPVFQYNTFVRDSGVSLWPIVQSLRNQITAAAVARRPIRREELLCRSFKAFGADDKLRNLSRVQLNSVESALSEVSHAARMFVSDATMSREPYDAVPRSAARQIRALSDMATQLNIGAVQ